MNKKENNNEKSFLLSQEENDTVIKKNKFHFLERSLLLKQTLIAAWKSKLQLVILLLLTAFATSLITGTWISYARIVEGEKFLQLDDANFDAVLPYPHVSDVKQIANQAFSLSLGRLYYQSSEASTTVAVYYDNTIIGQEIEPLSTNDLSITYTRDNHQINGISDFQWTNINHPLTFNLANDHVKASLYGQLINKAQQTTNVTLKNNYLNAASDLYNALIVNFSADQILTSLKTYFTNWIKTNPSDPVLNHDDQGFTTYLLANKVNYRGVGANDLRIPNNVNVADDINNPQGTLATKLLKETDSDPRLTPSTSSDYGMNGQWMRIYRDFDISPKPEANILSNFTQYYSSPSDYNVVTDDDDPQVYSYTIANAVAALQNRSVNVVNQFVGTAGVESATGKAISVKVVNLGLKKIHNNVNMKVFEGIYPSSRDQIAISPQYARSHKIRPGSTININNRPFIVSAIAGDAYNIYPTINSLDPVPNTRTEFIAYVLPDAFHDGSWFDSKDTTDVSLMYFLPWKNVAVPSFNIAYFNDYFQRMIFSDNKLADRNQYDYDQYLIEKYIKNNPDYPSKYHLSQNLVVTESDSQFGIYARGRNLLNSTLTGFKYAAAIGVIFLVGIIIFITYLIVKKAIQKSQVSMGILKSSGYSTWKIIISYLAYPIMVLLIAIPIGWFIGLAVQVYFTEIFNSLFILPYNVLDFNIVPLFISILLICGFVLFTTLITGYKMLQKEPLALIKQTNDISVGNSHKTGWLQAKFQNSFKARFLLSLSKTSWKKIGVTALVISIATLSITTTVSIPATITNMKNNYFKTQKYKNYYQYQTPIPNMPMSKYGLYAWNNLNNVNQEPYYPVSGTMPWPEDIIINDRTNGNKLAWYNPLEYKKNADNTNNFKNIIHFDASVPEETKNKIITQVGNQLLSLDNGPLSMNFLSWSYTWMGGRSFSNALLKDLSTEDLTENKNFSNSLITFATTVLPGILNVPNPGVLPGPDAIVEILKQTLPGFVRQILDSKGPNAYDYFSIGHNTVAYNPNYNSDVGGSEEELVTQFQLGSDNRNLVNRGFLDVEGINPETKMLVMNPNLVSGLKYNSSANIVPMVINRSFAAKFNLAVGNEFDAAPNVKTLYYLNDKNKLVPLPKDSWYYGANPVNQQPGDFGKKAIWSNSANKWNHRGTKQIDNTDYNDSYGYKYNGVYDKNGKRVLSDEPNGWNDMNQVWLKLPGDITKSALSGSLRTADASSSLTFNTNNIASSDGEWIKPFSYDVTDKYHGKAVEPINLIMQKAPEWYGGMLDKNILVVDNNLHLATLRDDIENNMKSWWEDIVGSPITKYHIIGIQDSYDTPRAYIDQKWANSILGYSYYKDRSETKDPIYAPGIYQWFSGKLSASDDIYDIIGRMSFKRSSDDYSIYSASSLNGNREEQLIANSDLLLRKKEMLEKMSDIALSASLLFIVTTILCSILIVIMITDAFTDQFRRFMSHMKAEGYTNREINSFTLGIFTPWVLVGYAVGYSLGFLTVFGFIKVVTAVAGLALPFSFIWWIIPLSFAIIAVIYFSTFILNIYQLNKMDLIELLKTDE